MSLRLAPEVDDALKRGQPVVALETSIVAQGLPAPHNLSAAFGCEDAIRAVGAVPATTALVEGELRVGLSRPEIEALAANAAVTKVSARDLGWGVARRAFGATTVAATVRLASLAGIRFMATGGIGGVHLGNPHDVSADLDEIGRRPVAVFCAGPKLVLDIPLTLERLETLSVPVIGYGADEVPAFYLRSSGRRADARVDDPLSAAEMLASTWATGGLGVVVVVPPPRELAGARALFDQAVDELRDVHGAQLTPRLLARVAQLSGGDSVDVNVELVVNNARVAAACAVAYASRASVSDGNQRRMSAVAPSGMTTTDRNDFNQQIIDQFRENNGVMVSGMFKGAPLLLLTTTGARSGQRRTSPLAYTRDDDRYVVIASKAGAPSHPDWYRNLVAHPEVTVEVGGETFEARASVVSGAERQRLYDAQAALMPNFAEYQRKTSREIPVVVLERIKPN